MKKDQQTAKSDSVKPNELGIAIKEIIGHFDALAYGLSTPAPNEYKGSIVIEKSTRTAILLVKSIESAIMRLHQFANNYPGINGFGVTGDGNTNLCEMNKMGDFIIRCSNFLPINVPVLNNDANNQTTKPC